MEGQFLSKVYCFVTQLMHFNDALHTHPIRKSSCANEKVCPITGLSIAMQQKNSKFLSFTGVKWYYNNKPEIFNKILLPRLTKPNKRSDIDSRCKEIAHNIRNADSNPRNNTKRAVDKLLLEKESLFNNFQLIDKQKLKEAGY